MDRREGPTVSFEEFERINEISMPYEYVVCPTCDGEGTHVNPSIDYNGITQDEMYDLGEEFAEAYFNGCYDVPCNECNGIRVVKIPVFNNNSDIEDAWNNYVDNVHIYRHEIAMGY